MENQGNSLIYIEKMVFDEYHWSSSKTDCTIEQSIPKLCETTLFHNSSMSHGRNNYQETLLSWKIKESH